MSWRFATPPLGMKAIMRQRKPAIALRLSAAQRCIKYVVRQSLGNLRVAEDDISNVAGVGGQVMIAVRNTGTVA